MATAQALVVHAAGDLRVEERTLPEPAPHEAVVAIGYGGVCGSDLHYVAHGAVGESVLRAPMVLGHEVSGRVAVAAADGSGPTEGTPVAVHPATPCGQCGYCAASRQNLCPHTSYLGSAARFPHTDGAFAQRYVVATDRLLPLPDALSVRTAALVEPASVAWHAVSRAGDVAGKRVLVTGAGPIGALVVAVLRRAGAAEIVVTDLHERPLRVARELGATRTRLGTAPEDLGADVAIDSSGAAAGVATAVRALRRGGHLVLLGLPPAPEQPFLSGLVATRELTVAGSFRFHAEMADVIAAMADGSLAVDAVISHEFPLAEAEQAFAVARDATASGKVLLRF
ncbi:L-idonate 5-dehydrogenase [Prauserella muralis]|uniref:L-idonate 5-dehydrogenase n=1 Tax=Prauserella muralis TaxID=588067 RepID=A0A2V4B285_9PSEU|nr:L-idonate 5-dehydrogenase [Prauserella muralis]PXY28163.1 L-idonate 5-dehydrogenase [Prauserella muralis]TWE22027.1 L-idonate 5-dehydrogenase [Prauserella muralis]